MHETVAQISRLSWRLAQWQDNLPAHLKIISSGETADIAARTLETTRLRIILSLRFLGTRILVLRPILSQFLDLTGTTSANEHQSKWFRSSGAVLLAEMMGTCRDVLHISKSILTASRNDQNILGAWWFSTYYCMTCPQIPPDGRCTLLTRCSIQCCPRNPGRPAREADTDVLHRALGPVRLRVTIPSGYSHGHPAGSG